MSYYTKFKVTPEMGEEYRQRYEDGESVRDIVATICAKGYVVSERRIQKAIIGAGGTLRTQKEASTLAQSRRKVFYK